MVKWYTPPAPTGGVPPMSQPCVVFSIDIQPGASFAEKPAGPGYPVDVRLTLDSVPTVNVALDGDVITVGWSTITKNACVASGAMPLLAVTVIGYRPPASGAGVPDSVPSWLSVTPAGKFPASVNVGAGRPLAMKVKEPD